jgi:cob(I)alamin adenosyltransferase
LDVVSGRIPGEDAMTALHDTLTEAEIAERNLALFQAHMEVLLENPERMAEIPEDAALFFIPSDDPALAGYNLARARQRATERPGVYLVYLSAKADASAPIPVSASQ